MQKKHNPKYPVDLIRYYVGMYHGLCGCVWVWVWFERFFLRGFETSAKFK